MTSVLKVDNIQNSSGTSAISVDSNGVVTKSTIPAFMISLTGDQSFTSSTTWHTISNMTDNQTNAFLQGGMTLSSGVVTVPVAGLYHFSANIRVDDVGSGYLWTQISKNNSNDTVYQHSSINGSPDGSYIQCVQSGLYQMDANDTVRIKVYASGDSSFHAANQSHFSGFLIG